MLQGQTRNIVKAHLLKSNTPKFKCCYVILTPLSLSFPISEMGIWTVPTSLGGIVGIQAGKAPENLSMGPGI